MSNERSCNFDHLSIEAWFCRGSRAEAFCKKRFLRNLTKLAGKHLCQCLFCNKVAGLKPFLQNTSGGCVCFGLFCQFCHLKNLFLTLWYWNEVLDIRCYLIPVIALERFRIVMHTYAVSFSIKFFYEASRIFYTKIWREFQKTIDCLWGNVKNKCNVLCSTFLLIFQTKIFAWKRDCVICKS